MLLFLLLEEGSLALLLSLYFSKLLPYIVLLLLALEVFHLHFELMTYKLVRLPCISATLLPVLHVCFLALHHLLMEQVHLFTSYTVIVLLLLLLELLQEFLVSFEFKICDHLVLHAGLILILLGSLDGINFLLHRLVAFVLHLFLVL